MNTQFTPSRIMWLLPLVALAVVSQLYLLLPVALSLSQAWGVSVVNISSLSTIFAFFYAIGMLFWGVLSDKYGRKRILLIGLSCLLLCTLILAWVHAFLGLLIVRGLQGFFAAAFPPVIMAWLAENVALSRRLKMIGYLSCAFLLAGVIGQSLGAWLIEQDLRQAMLVFAGLYALSIFLVLRLPEHQREGHSTIQIGHIIKNLPSLLVHPRLRPLYLSALLLLWAFVALYVLLIQHFEPQLSSMGLTVGQFRAVAIPAMLLSLNGMMLIRRFGQERIIMVALLALAVTLPLQYYALYALLKPVLLVAHFVFVAAISYCIPCLISAVGHHAEGIHTDRLSNVKGSALSLYTFLLFIGASLGAYLPNVMAAAVLLGVLVVGMLLSAGLLYLEVKRVA